MYGGSTGKGYSSGNWSVKWIHGSKSARHPDDPPIQVFQYDSNTAIMRESMDLSAEAPFMFLMFGKERAFLLDTGATKDENAFPIRKTVDSLIDKWQTRNHRPEYELIVAHSHGHADHIAGDAQFSDRPNTRIVPVELDGVTSFFGIENWPEQAVQFDLGGRLIEIIPVPGHDKRSISVYDPWTGFLLTGDTVYPGRLYISDYPAFLKSLDRLVSFSQKKTVTYILGCHIEMSQTPGKDYPATVKYQPDEAPLQMSVDQLLKVKDAANSVAENPGAHYFDDFAIFNGPSYVAVIEQLLRAKVANFRRMLS